MDPEKKTICAAAQVATTPLVERPAPNKKQEASRHICDALVWEKVARENERPWQWRAWLQGNCVGVVSISGGHQRYCVAAMQKKVGVFFGPEPTRADGDIPPCVAARDAVSFVVVELIRSGEAVEANYEALRDLKKGAEEDAVREACDQLERAHNARYNVDELDMASVVEANCRVEDALNACDLAWDAMTQAQKTAEMRAVEAQAVIDSAKDAIAAFNSRNTTAGRRS